MLVYQPALVCADDYTKYLHHKTRNRQLKNCRAAVKIAASLLKRL